MKQPAKKTPQSKKLLFILLTILLVLFVGVLSLLAYMGYFSRNATEDGPVVLRKETPAQSVPTKTEVFAKDLKVPWAMAFTSPTRMLVTERTGSIRIVENGAAQPAPLVTFADVSSESEEGLMGLALDPDYSQNKLVYACLAYQKQGGLADKIVRFRDNGNSISSLTTILEGIPAAQNHAGCRIKFGPDKKLYITSGDATNKEIAQDLQSLGGKILRINSDGSIPSDNPFANSPVWSYGHRNAQGIAWQPSTNQLYATEHGPTGFDGPGGGDEINAIAKGQNYGWPLVSHKATKAGTVAPLILFTPAVAPAGADFYSSTVLPQYNGNLIFATLRGEALYRVVFSTANPSEIASYEKLGEVKVGRIRDVLMGPDGYLYFASSNTDGRGTEAAGDDKIYRILPQ